MIKRFFYFILNSSLVPNGARGSNNARKYRPLMKNFKNSDISFVLFIEIETAIRFNGRISTAQIVRNKTIFLKYWNILLPGNLKRLKNYKIVKIKKTFLYSWKVIWYFSMSVHRLVNFNLKQLGYKYLNSFILT